LSCFELNSILRKAECESLEFLTGKVVKSFHIIDIAVEIQKKIKEEENVVSVKSFCELNRKFLINFDLKPLLVYLTNSPIYQSLRGSL